jgi:xylulose-5-phosphate/fructose-6-phosphate phosphoketolase
MAPATADLKRKTTDASKGDVDGPLSAEELRKIHACWRAANYLSVGQIYLMDNPLLKEPLRREHIKPRLLGHWGTTSGQNFLYVHKAPTARCTPTSARTRRA